MRILKPLVVSALAVVILAMTAQSVTASSADEDALRKCDELAASSLDDQRTAPAVYSIPPEAIEWCERAHRAYPENGRIFFQKSLIGRELRDPTLVDDMLKVIELGHDAGYAVLGRIAKKSRQEVGGYSYDDLLKIGLEKGMSWALYDRGKWYEEGRDKPPEQEYPTPHYETALEFYERAAAKGYSAGELAAGSLYYIGFMGKDKDTRWQGVPYFVRAAKMGDPMGAYLAGKAYLDGSVVEQDIEKGLDYYLEAYLGSGTGSMFVVNDLLWRAKETEMQVKHKIWQTLCEDSDTEDFDVKAYFKFLQKDDFDCGS
ncbi:tetratricopeptide repeat protein [Hwanghaeella grinnelliae]|nr:SEL1-like repeat protein [Hwanghaeella grinnelliae]